MSNKLHIIKCLNCIYVRRLKYSTPCIGCKHGEYDMGFHQKDKFVQRPGIHIRCDNNSMRW